VKRREYFELVDSLTVESFSEFQRPSAVPVVSG